MSEKNTDRINIAVYGSILFDLTSNIFSEIIKREKFKPWLNLLKILTLYMCK